MAVTAGVAGDGCGEALDDKMEALRVAVGVSHHHFDPWLYAFLENKKFNVAETVAKLERRAVMEREELGRIQIHTPGDHLRLSLAKGVIQVIGTDRQDRVILYVTTKRDVAEKKHRDENRDSFDMVLSYATRLRRRVPCAGDQPRINTECKAIMLINQAGASMLWNIDFAFQATIALRVSKFYPGLIDTLYICNMSRTLQRVAKPVFASLPAVVSDRIKIIPDEEMQPKGNPSTGLVQTYLSTIIDEDVLPVALGGRNECDRPECWRAFADSVTAYFEQLQKGVTEAGLSVKEWELQCVLRELEESDGVSPALLVQGESHREEPAIVTERVVVGEDEVEVEEEVGARDRSCVRRPSSDAASAGGDGGLPVMAPARDGDTGACGPAAALPPGPANLQPAVAPSAVEPERRKAKRPWPPLGPLRRMSKPHPTGTAAAAAAAATASDPPAKKRHALFWKRKSSGGTAPPATGGALAAGGGSVGRLRDVAGADGADTEEHEDEVRLLWMRGVLEFLKEYLHLRYLEERLEDDISREVLFPASQRLRQQLEAERRRAVRYPQLHGARRRHADCATPPAATTEPPASPPKPSSLVFFVANRQAPGEVGVEEMFAPVVEAFGRELQQPQPPPGAAAPPR